MPAHHVALADQARRELRRSAVLALRTTRNQRIPAVLEARLRPGIPMRATHLRDRLKPKRTTAAELAQARERMVEPVDRP
jgi:hypothetical protein